ncbi:MAG TPA: hypothetical protein VNO79_15755 [Actinomycetota bacterium]|nr:hypothetical protein [Actinomycetota bacterium]
MVIRIEGTIEALSPIHHGGDEKTGSTPVLRSITHWDPLQQRHVRLPFVSGNAIRGYLRRLVMRDLVARLGLEEVAPRLHHALFSGGVLESTDDVSGIIELEFRRSVRRAVPAIGLFGCSIANQMIPGCLRVRHAMPVCAEYRAYLPDWLAQDARAEQPVRSFTDVAFATRRDDLREERAAEEPATQMKVDFEAFVGGTLFTHGFALVQASELEAACLGRAIELWREEPYIGGKSSSGYGEVRLAYEGVPDAGPYLAYLDDRREAVAEVLGDLGGRLRA